MLCFNCQGCLTQLRSTTESWNFSVKLKLLKTNEMAIIFYKTQASQFPDFHALRPISIEFFAQMDQNWSDPDTPPASRWTIGGCIVVLQYGPPILALNESFWKFLHARLRVLKEMLFRGER